MDEFVQFICNGSTTFTPDMLIRFMGFMMILDMLGCVLSAAMDAGKR